MVARSWLFAPGHNERILAKVFDAGADEVILDLEDGVGPEFKERARGLVSEVLQSRPAWVRINQAGTVECERDLEAVSALAFGLRLPKVESAGDIAWVAERLDGRQVPLTAIIETALGVVNTLEIARVRGVSSLSFGNVDFGADLGTDPADWEAGLHARSQVVLASRAARIEPPSDGVHTNFQDDEGLRQRALKARRLGFGGKSAIHPRQVPIINEVFSPSAAEVEWALEVVAVYSESKGAAAKTSRGEMVDVPVYERAVRILSQAGER